MEWADTFWILWEYGSKTDRFLAYISLSTEVIPIGSQKSRPVHITGPSKDEI